MILLGIGAVVGWLGYLVAKAVILAVCDLFDPPDD